MNILSILTAPFRAIYNALHAVENAVVLDVTEVFDDLRDRLYAAEDFATAEIARLETEIVRLKNLKQLHEDEQKLARTVGDKIDGFFDDIFGLRYVAPAPASPPAPVDPEPVEVEAPAEADAPAPVAEDVKPVETAPVATTTALSEPAPFSAQAS